MIDKNAVAKVAKDFFEAIDKRDWDMFNSNMAEQVDITMRSPEGEKKSIKTNQEITKMWKDWFAMPYDKTLHILKNLEVISKDDKAIAKVDIDSTHFLCNEKWIGIGTYIFIIRSLDGHYKITDLDYTLQIIDDVTFYSDALLFY